MLRSFWQQTKDFIYNAVSDVFRSQADIDIEVESYISDWSTVVYDEGDLPPEATLRKRTFLSPQDVVEYLSQGGPPADYVYVLIDDDQVTPDGDQIYEVWITQ